MEPDYTKFVVLFPVFLSSTLNLTPFGSCCRAGWQSAAADPTLPLGAAVAFSVWRFFDKRRKRNPDGPFWGNSPVWGAVASTILGLFFGFVVRFSQRFSVRVKVGVCFRVWVGC